MDAVAKGNVCARILAFDIKLFAVRENLLIAVRRSQQQQQVGPFRGFARRRGW
jgi:hypothetical protein